jgi:hypothetical protein
MINIRCVHGKKRKKRLTFQTNVLNFSMKQLFKGLLYGTFSQ